MAFLQQLPEFAGCLRSMQRQASLLGGTTITEPGDVDVGTPEAIRELGRTAGRTASHRETTSRGLVRIDTDSEQPLGSTESNRK